MELEKRTGESSSSERPKKEEGEIGGGDRGSEGGGRDLNLGSS